ncbi:MAG: nascent polypeptide-associated complex protein [Candidatus Bathyarchaeota archaeon]|nr:nascent polypeptide-associated complex protein [Candidatus Bathyarchaeum tardum]WGM90651.1 MAG: nascent polypeptide-associated complex protein [Candidatus Bathyarchaeum tardum]WNZ30356.1 MAG: nascent polypeptide-associated complex protein [Candidatus Bathyarchaeota archaeon]
MRRKMNPRNAKRMMQKMGMNMGEMPEVEEVIFKTSTKEIVVENAQVAVIDMGGQKIFQVTGQVTERALEGEAETVEIPEEDAQLVADQTGKTVEDAKRALEQSDGDLAKAILLLQTGG